MDDVHIILKFVECKILKVTLIWMYVVYILLTCVECSLEKSVSKEV